MMRRLMLVIRWGRMMKSLSEVNILCDLKITWSWALKPHNRYPFLIIAFKFNFFAVFPIFDFFTKFKLIPWIFQNVFAFVDSKLKQDMLCFSVQLSQDMLVLNLVSWHIFWTNILLTVKAGYTRNFTFLSHLEGS